MAVNVSESTSMAHFIDTKSLKVIANTLVDTRPRVAEFTADGKHVWVSSEVGGTVAVIDAATHTIQKKIEFDVPGLRKEYIQPMGIRFSRDGRIAFVAIGRANRVAVVDADTWEVRQYILVGQRVWQLALSTDGTKLYAANGLTNDVSIIDVGSLKVDKSVPVGRLPWGIVYKP
jgi:PQQ-dependent catabolism-associated beta-propeller protein